jgi:hypothetical protein
MLKYQFQTSVLNSHSPRAILAVIDANAHSPFRQACSTRSYYTIIRLMAALGGSHPHRVDRGSWTGYTSCTPHHVARS